MKYGVLWRKTTKNKGDDMQSYAASLWLPRIDYMVDVAELDTFEVPDDEPVATIMSFWYMWHKWNWPPAKQLYPMWMGVHYSDKQRGRPTGMVSKYEYLTDGVGRDYLRMYEPIGCRDYYTTKAFDALGISNEFTGCITLTLPKREIKPQKREYVVLVGVEKRVENAVREQLEGTNIDVKVIAPTRENPSDNMTWEERKAEIEEMLDTYQNAKCVITFRLHCALPCLALETPVLLVRHSFASPRFQPYKDWLHTAFPEQVVDGLFKDFILNPPANPDDYKPVREAIGRRVKDFLAKAAAENRKASEIWNPPYTEQEKLEWQNKMMKQTLHNFNYALNNDTREINALKKQLQKEHLDTGNPDLSARDLVGMYRRHRWLFDFLQKIYHIFK